MKKAIAAFCAALMCLACFAGCKKKDESTSTPTVNEPEINQPEDNEPEVNPPKDDEPEDNEPVYDSNLSADGYVKDKIGDFTQYEGTEAYRVVTTAEEFLQAIVDAKCHYVNTWDDTTKTYTQSPADGYTEDNFKGTVRVIEIANDLNLGYKKLNLNPSTSQIVTNYAKNADAWTPYLYMSDMLTENGMSQIKVENTSDLLIYSKNGAKLTHAGFKLTSDNNVVFRNLEFDELWQWEDAPRTDTDKVGDYDWFGWAYFKISFSGYIWIDHCTFGKSYDGQIDYSNPVYNANAGTAFRAPYGADGGNGLHISNCRFNAGSDDPNGYIYKMMSSIEENYQASKADSSVACTCLYYKVLRDGGVSFEDILYGLAIPQKKGFLCGDDATFSSATAADDYNFNLKLQVSFANCVFKNIEDRLPKLRGGNAYMYNCIVDCSQYYTYRSSLKPSAASLVQAVNPKWKCALVSQGIVCGNGGSVMAENCIYSGIDTLLKNNDTKNSGQYVMGGYNLVNCSYKRASNEQPIVGSTADNALIFGNDTPTKLKTENFAWHTPDGTKPFEITAVPLDGLENYLSDRQHGAGAGEKLDCKWLESKVMTAE